MSAVLSVHFGWRSRAWSRAT